jgi:hypothetical protein
LALSTVGIPVAFLSYSAALHDPTGGATKETFSSTVNLIGGVVGAGIAGYVSLVAEDPRVLGRVAGELGYGVDGVTTQVFFGRCLSDNRSNPEKNQICTSLMEELRKQARNGTMCSWNVFSR